MINQRQPDALAGKPARLVAAALERHLPSPSILTAEQRNGDPDTYSSEVLHSEPDGSFSIVALVWLPGQVTPIHDHVTWCVFGVIQGMEWEELFELDEQRTCLVEAGYRLNQTGAVSGFAPPGLRPVALTGMILLGSASLALTQVSVDGSYLGDLLLGLLLFGAGLGATFVAAQIAGLSGVAETESGLAAGLVDSSFNVGSALGIAVLSTVAVARTDAVLSGSDQPTSNAVALTEGFQTAFLVALGIAVLGALLAALLFPRQEGIEDATIEARRVPPCPPARASALSVLAAEPEIECYRLP